MQLETKKMIIEDKLTSEIRKIEDDFRQLEKQLMRENDQLSVYMNAAHVIYLLNFAKFNF